MRTTPIAALVCATAVGSPMTERITSGALQQKRSSNSSIASLTQQAQPNAHVVRAKGQSLIKQSLIISDGTNWTLVPRGAVLHTPDSHTARVNAPPVGNLVSWQEFLNMNHAWIAGEEISLRQAEGADTLDPRRIAYWPKQSKVIVAVHRGGPVSVNPPKTAQNSNTP